MNPNLTAENYDLIVFASLGLAGIFFIFSIVLFIRYNIPKVLGDLTGTSTKRGIRQKQEEKMEKKEKKTKVQKSKKKRVKESAPMSGETELINQASVMNQTEVIGQNETMLLNDPVTGGIQYDATQVLSDATQVQYADDMMIEDDITMTDTTNIIE